MEQEQIVIEIKPINRAREFVKRHKTAIAVSATAVFCFVVHKAALRDHDEFLAEKGLLDEFYSPEDSEE